MIGRLLAAAHALRDLHAAQPVRRLRRQQQMVDAQALVLLPGAGLIIPERIKPRRVADGAQRIGKSKRQQLAKIAVNFAVLTAIFSIDDPLRALRVLAIDIAHRDDLAVVFAEECVHVACALPADADATHRDFAGRRDRAVLAQHARRKDRRECERRARDARASQKITARKCGLGSRSVRDLFHTNSPDAEEK